MQIGTLKLDVPLLLAPMAGITDLPFRVICRELGCGMTVSEMVSAKGLLYKNVKTFDMLRIDPGERPTAIQLFGSVPAELAEAARIVAGNGADVIDFNMGCPVPKVVNNGEGSALMKNPQLAEDVRKLMFVFEDIAYLDPLSVQRFLREIDSKDLSVALKVANRDVTATIFSNMSNRMRESIQSDMEYLHNIRMSDVEEAQQRIVAVIRRLEEEGEIVISKDGKDEIIV